MRSKLRSHRPSHAIIVAYLALFVALGGSSYAAIKVTGKNVPKDALTGADIKSLTGKDVTNNSLTGADVKGLTAKDVTDGSLLSSDFAPGQLPAGPQGPQGPSGPMGEKGAIGEAGSDGQDGAPGADGEDGAPGADGQPGFSFGEAIPGDPNGTTLNICNPTTLVSKDITITEAARISVNGQAEYYKGASNFQTGLLRARLRNSADTTTIAAAAEGAGQASGPDGRAFVATSGVMVTTDNMFSTTPFVATPGTYKLQLIADAGDGSCLAAAAFMGRISLSYVLIGTGS